MSNNMFRKVIGQKPADPKDDLPGTPPPSSPDPTPLAPLRAPSTAAAPADRSAPTPQPVSSQSVTRNVLSSDVDIKGSVKFTNDLVVDGKIEGEISSNGNLTVGENARLKAEIKTATVVVYGKIHGNIVATDRVDLKASAEVVGDIKSKTLSIEAGAIFVGKSTVGTPSTPGNTPSQSSPQPKPQTQAQKPAEEPPQKSTVPAGDPAKPQQGDLAGIKN